MKAFKTRNKSANLDTVGVAGSIPVEPTIHELSRGAQVVVIPDNYDVVPAIEYIDGKPHLFRCLIKKTDKRREAGVKRPNRRRSA